MIEFQSVGKTFRGGAAALTDLRLTVPAGKITVIVGPPGSGKTTVLQLVLRMLEPSSGQISWDGAPLKSKRRTAVRRQLGYVGPGGGLFPHRTVAQNIATVPRLLGRSKAKSELRALELLGAVGLDRFLAHRYPAQLTSGQPERIGLARALAADPAVLLLDDPFSAAAPAVRKELQQLLLDLQRRTNQTILLATEDIEEALRLGGQVVVLGAGGRQVQVGTPQQLLDEPVDAYVADFVGRDRGYRSLAFLPASGLALEPVKVVREVASAGEHGPTLVVDGQAKPVGWANQKRPGQVVLLSSTFTPEVDDLRTALDSALTSPYGLAVAVEPSGRFAGVVDARHILEQAREARAATADHPRGEEKAEATVVVMRRRPSPAEVPADVVVDVEDHDNVRVG